MSTSPALQPSPALALSEPTIHDLALAGALGYERPPSIRKLIKRHADLLEAMGPLRQRGAMVAIGSGAQRAVTEYHLNRAQATFIITKAGTKRANSLAALVAEVFAMFTGGKLLAADEGAANELEGNFAREQARQMAINAEEREARSDAFALLGRGRARRRCRRRPQRPSKVR